MHCLYRTVPDPTIDSIDHWEEEGGGVVISVIRDAVIQQRSVVSDAVIRQGRVVSDAVTRQGILVSDAVILQGISSMADAAAVSATAVTTPMIPSRALSAPPTTVPPPTRLTSDATAMTMISPPALTPVVTATASTARACTMSCRSRRMILHHRHCSDSETWYCINNGYSHVRQLF